jgi:signal transduction histidine kinase
LITDESGTPKFWEGVLVDITQQKRAEELERDLQAERETAQRLRDVDEMKNTFLQAVSHDLRTPLAAILGLAVTMERQDLDLDTSDIHDMSRRIAQNARKLDRLVNDLLDLDRLSRGIIEPSLRRTDVGELVHRLVEESDVVSERPVKIDVQRVVILADAAKVERIVENLLANATRHTPRDASVWVRVEPSGQGALITVEDDGPGVAPEIRQEIFEPFRQGPDAPTHSPGVGVGLTLVARFAELHGGRAWVEDRDGGGASFKVFLSGSAPQADQRAGESSSSSEASQA